MNGKWAAGLLASLILLGVGAILQEQKEQRNQIGDIQVRVSSIDTALEILVDGYSGSGK